MLRVTYSPARVGSISIARSISALARSQSFRSSQSLARIQYAPALRGSLAICWVKYVTASAARTAWSGASLPCLSSSVETTRILSAALVASPKIDLTAPMTRSLSRRSGSCGGHKTFELFLQICEVLALIRQPLLVGVHDHFAVVVEDAEVERLIHGSDDG